MIKAIKEFYKSGIQAKYDIATQELTWRRGEHNYHIQSWGDAYINSFEWQRYEFSIGIIEIRIGFWKALGAK